MSDISRGEGWWQASDRKWYPPDLHPDHRPREPAATEPAAAEPPPPPVAEPSPLPGPPAAGPEPRRRGRGVGIVAAAVVAVVALVAAVVLLSRDGGNKTASASSSSSVSQSASSAPFSSSSSSPLTETQLRARLLAPTDVGTDFVDDTFSPNRDPTLPCGTPNPDLATPPTIDVGMAAKAPAGVAVQEEFVAYASDTLTKAAFGSYVNGHSCSQGTITNSGSSQPIQFTAISRARELNVADAVEIDFTASGFHGQLFFIRTAPGMVAFSFAVLDSVDRATVPDALTIVKRGLAKLGS